jgi:hypothetical protein
MNRTDLRVYDDYQTLFNTLVRGATTLHQIPLEDMLDVLDRVEQAGCYNLKGRVIPMEAEDVANHRTVVHAARAFRDAVTAAMAAPAEPAKPDEAAEVDEAAEAGGLAAGTAAAAQGDDGE